ncbi:cytochrome P450 [Micromonospora sp. KC721]|uniref:cytochrome P450 n=1 Tax=Micromonospora sp. KC721 TaxID=2530380 RepID=UPI0010486F00|nr:cytochrome P450 [Micromonospora sp. KC721]TDB82480.1 cytochrome P450 [Micromonospora sp. KC721]
MTIEAVVDDAIMDPGRLTDPAVHARGETRAVWRWMRRHAPVHWHEPGVYPGFWSVTRYADVRRVYLDHATFSSAHGVMLRPITAGADPGSGLTLALTDPPRHTAIRALVADAFSGRQVRSFEENVRRSARAVLDAARERQTCDFVHDVAAHLTVAVIGAILGIPASDHDDVLRWTSESFAAGRSLATHHELMRYVIELIDLSTADPGDDVVGRLVAGTVDGDPLSDVEILLNCENIIGAAENSGLSIAAGIVAFAEHPDQWSLLVQRPDQLPSAVNEILRWTSSASHSMRTATAPVLLGDHTIAPGDRVVVWLPSANRDEEVFVAPDEFRVTRRPNRHLSFGAGPHACIGAALARIQTTVLLSELLDAGLRVEPAGPAVPVASIVVSGPAYLPVHIVAGGPGDGTEVPRAPVETSPNHSQSRTESTRLRERGQCST